MQLLDHPFRNRVTRVVYDVVDCAEVVLRFHDVVDAQGFALDADGCRLEDEARLVEREPASLDVV